MTLIFNLLSIPQERLYGVGNFLKSLTLDYSSPETDIIIYCSSNIDPISKFGFGEFKSIKVKKVNIKNPINRIFYEQIVMPFYLKNANLIYSPNNINPIFLPRNIKSIITIHDTLPFENQSRYHLFQIIYLRLFTSISIRISYRVITVSHSSAKSIVKHFPNAENKISIVTNSVCPPLHIKDLKYSNYFLYVGALNHDKRIDCIIKSFYEFSKSNTSSILIIAGQDQGSFNSLSSLAYDLNISERVIFMGFIDEDDKWSLIKNCIALFLFGRSEGFGIPVLEAISLKIPVIVSNSGSLPEVVGDAGFILDPYNTQKVALTMISLFNGHHFSPNLFDAQMSKFNRSFQRSKFWSLLLRDANIQNE